MFNQRDKQITVKNSTGKKRWLKDAKTALIASNKIKSDGQTPSTSRLFENNGGISKDAGLINGGL